MHSGSLSANIRSLRRAHTETHHRALHSHMSQRDTKKNTLIKPTSAMLCFVCNYASHIYMLRMLCCMLCVCVPWVHYMISNQCEYVDATRFLSSSSQNDHRQAHQILYNKYQHKTIALDQTTRSIKDEARRTVRQTGCSLSRRAHCWVREQSVYSDTNLSRYKRWTSMRQIDNFQIKSNYFIVKALRGVTMNEIRVRDDGQQSRAAKCGLLFALVLGAINMRKSIRGDIYALFVMKNELDFGCAVVRWKNVPWWMRLNLWSLWNAYILDNRFMCQRARIFFFFYCIIQMWLKNLFAKYSPGN